MLWHWFGAMVWRMNIARIDIARMWPGVYARTGLTLACSQRGKVGALQLHLSHTYIPTVLPSRSFTTSFVFPSFSDPATTFETHYWKKLTCGVIRSFNFRDNRMVVSNLIWGMGSIAGPQRCIEWARNTWNNMDDPGTGPNSRLLLFTESRW